MFQNNFRDNISIWGRSSERKRKENHRWNILVSNCIHTIYRLAKWRWAGGQKYVVCKIMKDTCTFLVTKFQLKKLLRKPKCREKDNIKMDLRQKTWVGTMFKWIKIVSDIVQWRTFVNIQIQTGAFLNTPSSQGSTVDHTYLFALASLPTPPALSRVIRLPALRSVCELQFTILNRAEKQIQLCHYESRMPSIYDLNFNYTNR